MSTPNGQFADFKKNYFTENEKGVTQGINKLKFNKAGKVKEDDPNDLVLNMYNRLKANMKSNKNKYMVSTRINGQKTEIENLFSNKKELVKPKIQGNSLLNDNFTSPILRDIFYMKKRLNLDPNEMNAPGKIKT